MKLVFSQEQSRIAENKGKKRNPLFSAGPPLIYNFWYLVAADYLLKE